MGEIVGEEDESSLDITTPPFRAGEISAPAELEQMIITMRDRVDELKATIPSHPDYKQLCVFIDPIDGTKEFCTGKGEQCSICIGLADRTSGMTVAGLVYRPLCPIRSYGLGCVSEGIKESRLQQHEALPGGAFLVSNGGASPFLEQLQAELGYALRGQGGAGNKALRVLEEANGCYIQDRGVSRWDTCAAQAVIEAHGGCFLQLHPLTIAPADAPAPRTRYRYLKGPTNADFVPGVTRLNKYNAVRGALSEAEAAKGAPPKYASELEQLKPYSNLLGHVALRDGGEAAVEGARAAILRAAAKEGCAPAFD